MTTREAHLEAALKAMLQSVCGPTGFAEAVRHNSGLSYPWHSLDAAEAQAITALSTPATEPQAGYVEGLGLRRIVEEIDGAMNHGTWRDEHGMRLKDTPEWVAFYNSLAAETALS